MSKQIKKIIPYFFVLIILFGLFGLTERAEAQTVRGKCVTYVFSGTYQQEKVRHNVSPTDCPESDGDSGGQYWVAYTTSDPAPPTDTPPTTTTTPLTPTEKSALANNVPSCWNLLKFDIGKCLVSISYFVFYTIPSSLLGLSAIFFNAVIALALSSIMYTTSFISSAWTVVRDLSNIFFILILLYIAIKTILGLGGHEIKKMIAHVIIMALLINFSMFFTKVVIDSSNILALIFYNKINVETPGSTPRAYSRIWSPVQRMVADRDISGGIFASFDPTRLMTQGFFDRAKKKTQNVSALGAAAYIGGGAAVAGPIGALAGAGVYTAKAIFSSSSEVPDSLILTIIIVSGLLMAFAAYAFFIAGISFVSRLVELWVLIIFSPFAFMSSAIPLLSKIEYIGWDSWLHRLLKTSFMAPIFMFFIYLIFLFVQVPLLKNLAITGTEQDTYQVMVLIILQALITLVLLLKATKFAKEGSGKLGEALISGAKLVAGLAIGGAALGGAGLLRGSVGAIMKGASTGETAASRMANNKGILSNATSGRMEKIRAGIDIGKGYAQKGLGIDWFQRTVGPSLNADQTLVETASHARHELDTEASTRFQGKKFNDLTQPERNEIRTRISRDKEGFKTFGKKYKELTATDKSAVDTTIGSDAKGNAIAGGALANKTSHADKLIKESKIKQGLGSTILQSARTGSYDVRNLANIIAKEQSTGFAKFASGLTGALAMSMRGGFKSMGVNYGESQGEFFKDLGHTISESLKSAKIHVDLSHVGEVKKESDKGKGGGGGHH